MGLHVFGMLFPRHNKIPFETPRNRFGQIPCLFKTIYDGTITLFIGGGIISFLVDYSLTTGVSWKGFIRSCLHM